MLKRHRVPRSNPAYRRLDGGGSSSPWFSLSSLSTSHVLISLGVLIVVIGLLQMRVGPSSMGEAEEGSSPGPVAVVQVDGDKSVMQWLRDWYRDRYFSSNTTEFKELHESVEVPVDDEESHEIEVGQGGEQLQEATTSSSRETTNPQGQDGDIEAGHDIEESMSEEKKSGSGEDEGMVESNSIGDNEGGAELEEAVEVESSSHELEPSTEGSDEQEGDSSSEIHIAAPVSFVKSIKEYEEDTLCGDTCLSYEELAAMDHPPWSFPIAVVTHARHHLLNLTLHSLLYDVKWIDPSRITVYQDGTDSNVEKTVNAYQSRFPIQFARSAPTMRYRDGAANIARHYKYTFTSSFDNNENSQFVIVVEEDMVFAKDFLTYFAQMVSMYEKDDSVYCITSWNDNGFRNVVADPANVLRTDFFIGLGWLVSRAIYKGEWERQWPNTHWDHWARDARRRKNRECLYPEVPRHYNIGAIGAHSSEELFNLYFKYIMLHDGSNERLMDTGKLMQAEYKRRFGESIRSGTAVDDLSWVQGGTLRPTIGELLSEEITTDPHELFQRLVQGRPAPSEVLDWDFVFMRTYDENGNLITQRERYRKIKNNGENYVLVFYNARSSADIVWERSIAPTFGIWHSVPLIRNNYQGVQSFRWTDVSSDPRGKSPDLWKHLVVFLIPSYSGHFATKNIKSKVFNGADFESSRPELVLPDGIEIIAAERNEDCNTACARLEGQFRCQKALLKQINRCSFLEEHFSCKECSHNFGEDQPAHVVDPSDGNYQHCLVNTGAFSCEKSHPATRRLCACSSL